MARTKLNTRQLGLIDNSNLDGDLSDIGNLATLGVLVRIEQEEIVATYDLNLESLKIQGKSVATEDYVSNKTLSFSGDVSGTGTDDIILSLANVGTPGSYSKITTDTKGRVVSGRDLTNAEIITYLGYTPANKHDTQLTGTLKVEEGNGQVGITSDTLNFGIPLRTFDGTPTINFYATNGNALPDAKISVSGGTLDLTANRFTFNGDDVWFCYDADIFSTHNTINTLSQVLLDSYVASHYHAVEYFVAIINNSVVHSTKLIVANDGTHAALSEYGTILFGESFGSLDADMNEGNVRLFFTPSIQTTLIVKAIRIGIRT